MLAFIYLFVCSAAVVAEIYVNSSSTSNDFYCTQRNEAAWSSFNSWSSANLRLGLTEESTIYQTIQSFGSTTVYTACDNITRVRFIGSPTASRTTNVTVIHTRTTLYVPGSEEEEKKVWDTVACKTPQPNPAAPGFGGFGGVYDKWPISAPCHEQVRDYYEKIINRNTTVTERLPLVPCKEWAYCHFLIPQEILLIFWAPEPRKSDVCGALKTEDTFNQQANIGSNSINMTTASSFAVTTSSLTFKGRDLYQLGNVESNSSTITPITYSHSKVLPGPFIFVSPKMYLAHHAIFATIQRVLTLKSWHGKSDATISTSWSSEIHSAGVLEIHSSDVFTWAGRPESQYNDIEYAQRAAEGKVSQWAATRNGSKLIADEWDYKIRPFNFQDLEYPIPASVWFDARSDCWGHQTHCRTITEDNYRPKISINHSIWESMVAKFSYSADGLDCYRPQLIDPPIVLRPLSSGSPVGQSGIATAEQRQLPTPTLHLGPYIHNDPPKPGFRPHYPSPTQIQSPNIPWRHARIPGSHRNNEYYNNQDDNDDSTGGHSGSFNGNRGSGWGEDGVATDGNGAEKEGNQYANGIGGYRGEARNRNSRPDRHPGRPGSGDSQFHSRTALEPSRSKSDGDARENYDQDDPQAGEEGAKRFTGGAHTTKTNKVLQRLVFFISVLCSFPYNSLANVFYI